MPTPPKCRVGVIVVNYNSGGYLRDCIKSVNLQRFELAQKVLVDNNSDDDSVDLAQPHLSDWQVIRADENLGFARANNIAAASFNNIEWIALLNPDAQAPPNWLEKLVEASQEFPDGGSFGGLLVNLNDHEKADGSGDVYHQSGLHWRRDHGQPLARVNRDAGEVFSVCAAAAIYNFESFRQLGGFDESFFCYAEDVDLGFRFRLSGLKNYYVPQAVAYHAGSAITGRHSDFSVYYGHRNLVWVYLKNLPLSLLIKWLPQFIILNILSVLRFAMSGQLLPVTRAKFDALKGLRRVLVARKQIQDSRVVDVKSLQSAISGGILLPYRRNRSAK